MNCCKYIINCLFGRFYTNIDELNNTHEYSQAELVIINNKLLNNKNNKNINYSSFSSINNYDLI
jgi:hypothetical protein